MVLWTVQTALSGIDNSRRDRIHVLWNILKTTVAIKLCDSITRKKSVRLLSQMGRSNVPDLAKITIIKLSPLGLVDCAAQAVTSAALAPAISILSTSGTVQRWSQKERVDAQSAYVCASCMLTLLKINLKKMEI